MRTRTKHGGTCVLLPSHRQSSANIFLFGYTRSYITSCVCKQDGLWISPQETWGGDGGDVGKDDDDEEDEDEDDSEDGNTNTHTSSSEQTASGGPPSPMPDGFVSNHTGGVKDENEKGE